MIGKLAAGVAHELNNPLDAALRCVRLTRDRVNGDEEATRVPRSGRDGHAAHGGHRAEPAHLLAQRDASSRPRSRSDGLVAGDGRVRARWRWATTRPAFACDDAIRDVARLPVPRGLHQVLTNLLRNAYDAAGRDQPIARRAPARDDATCVLEVRDRGPGHPARHPARVFEPFFTTKAPGQGTGLGLPLSARMVEKFGGGIRIECPSGGRHASSPSCLPLPSPSPRPRSGGERRP